MCPSVTKGIRQPPFTAEASGLFHGVESAVAETLGIRSYRHKSAVDALCRRGTASQNCNELVDTMLALCVANWTRNVSHSGRRPSRQNWRWFDPKSYIAKHNRSPEVSLERALIGACIEKGRRDWSNQVPVASGLIGPLDGRRRAIDLVHQRSISAFDFVELKVGSDNPLYAAVEIVLYGLIWLLSRRHRATLGYAGNPLIEARDIHLSVLAPRSFYRNADWTWLSGALDDSLCRVGRQNDGLELRFGFEEFPPDFRWPADLSAEQLLGHFDGRQAR